MRFRNTSTEYDLIKVHHSLLMNESVYLCHILDVHYKLTCDLDFHFQFELKI